MSEQPSEAPTTMRRPAGSKDASSALRGSRYLNSAASSHLNGPDPGRPVSACGDDERAVRAELDADLPAPSRG